jgi:IS4 transposase
VHVFITNDMQRDIDELARSYDQRAAIEPLIAELKSNFAIGKVSTNDFAANEAFFLLKVLAYNLMRRWVLTNFAGTPIIRWRAAWIRRACVLVPARLLRKHGRWELRLAPRPMLN